MRVLLGSFQLSYCLALFPYKHTLFFPSCSVQKAFYQEVFSQPYKNANMLQTPTSSLLCFIFLCGAQHHLTIFLFTSLFVDYPQKANVLMAWSLSISQNSPDTQQILSKQLLNKYLSEKNKLHTARTDTSSKSLGCPSKKGIIRAHLQAENDDSLRNVCPPG